jgi:hypothetical protein
MAATKNESLLGVNDDQATLPATPAPKTSERRYEVTENAEVPRGHHRFMLHRGQVVSSVGYDLEELKRAGVKLREIK